MSAAFFSVTITDLAEKGRRIWVDHLQGDQQPGQPTNPLGPLLYFLIRRTPVTIFSSSSKKGHEEAYFKDPVPQKSKTK